MLVLGLALVLAVLQVPPPVPAPTPPAGPEVVLETSQGNIRIALDTVKAPLSVDNFLKYVRSGFYDGTIFHRVIAGFMVQGGGLTADMKPKETRAAIRNESKNGLSNRRGTVAMARTSDPNSATAQFFVNHKDNLGLDYGMRDAGYAVFGQVVEGMDVVDKIAAVATSSGDVPLTPVVIRHARVVGEDTRPAVAKPAAPKPPAAPRPVTPAKPRPPASPHP